MLQLTGEHLAQVQIAVDHGVDHAEREVSRADGQAVARRGGVRWRSVQRKFGIRQKALDKTGCRVTAWRVHADETAVKHRKTHRLGADAVNGGQALTASPGLAGLTVGITSGFFVVVFGLSFSLRGQPPEDNQVVHRGRVVVRRVRRAGQVLAMQVQQRRAAQVQCRLLKHRLRRFKLMLLHEKPHKTIRWRLDRRRVYKSQAVGGEFNDLHVWNLF